MIGLRAEYANLHRRKFFQGRSIRGEGIDDIKWFEPSGQEMSDLAWNVHFVRCLGVQLNGNREEDALDSRDPVRRDSLFVMFNAHHERIYFVLPEVSGHQWERLVDTSLKIVECPVHRAKAYISPGRPVGGGIPPGQNRKEGTNQGGSEESESMRTPFVSDFDLHLLAEGSHFRTWEKLGAHVGESDEGRGVHFAVWAPNAERVSVIGDFNGWDKDDHPMQLRPEAGVWETFVPGIGAGALYKYRICSGGLTVSRRQSGSLRFCRGAASGNRIQGLYARRLPWGDGDWMESRATASRNLVAHFDL